MMMVWHGGSAPTRDEEDVTFYWEVGDNGWITRHVELAGPNRLPLLQPPWWSGSGNMRSGAFRNTRRSTAFWQISRSRGGIPASPTRTLPKNSTRRYGLAEASGRGAELVCRPAGTDRPEQPAAALSRTAVAISALPAARRMLTAAGWIPHTSSVGTRHLIRVTTRARQRIVRSTRVSLTAAGPNPQRPGIECPIKPRAGWMQYGAGHPEQRSLLVGIALVNVALRLRHQPADKPCLRTGLRWTDGPFARPGGNATQLRAGVSAETSLLPPRKRLSEFVAVCRRRSGVRWPGSSVSFETSRPVG